MATNIQQALLEEIYSLVSDRPPGACNFLEGSELVGGKDVRIIYRNCMECINALILDATLCFVFVTDEAESELGILDLIQVFVQVLDRCFENVCELDLVRELNSKI